MGRLRQIILRENGSVMNRIGRNYFLIVTKGSNVDIYECHFLKNVINAKSTSMLLIVDGNISITNTRITNNTLGKNLNIIGTNLIAIDSSFVTQVSNSIFMHNIFDYMLNAVSAPSNSRSLLLVYNCSFILNILSSISTENVQDVLIENSFSYIYDDIVVPEGISINNAKRSRIKGSVFNATDTTLQMYFEDIFSETSLFTMDLVFYDDSRTLTSNSTNFLHQAESIGYIFIDSPYKVEQTETPYASSKNNFRLLFPAKHLSEKKC